ncbi:MAG: primosomal protein N' [Ignavibacteria bacterium]|nr:primosomal protein N' [Ignavibacteria bacterium]
MNLFAEIAVPAAIETLFTYRVPNEFTDRVQIGARVKIPFGTKTIVGVVIRLTEKTSVTVQLKSIHSLLDTKPIFNSELLNTLCWIAEYYIAPLGEVLNCALPQGLKQQEPRPKLEQGISISEEQKQQWVKRLLELGNSQRNTKQRLVLETLFNTQKHFLSLTELSEITSASPAVLKSMREKGMVQYSSREIIRKEILLPSEHEKQSLRIIPNEYQRTALEKISAQILSRTFHSFLLFGITGSGKTQVYIEAIRKTLEQGKTAIILVPEISLTPQAVRRFQLHFGEMVTVIHSQMSDGERFDSWRLTLNGTYKVVIGPRSAIFAPTKNLGLIVVDEEHESSYKQYDMTPHYHARNVALVRAKENNAVVILGSATPSAESYYNAIQHKYTLLELPERADNARLPEIQIVDLRTAKNIARKTETEMNEAVSKQQFHSPSASKVVSGKQEGTVQGTLPFGRSLSPLLLQHINERLGKKEGIILLQNRRGFSSYVECTRCGNVETCTNCSVSLTYHSVKQLLRCHYCGYAQKLPILCLRCGNPRAHYKGIGTQRVEEELQNHFPLARIARMDLDTTSRKGAHDTILTSFGKRDIDILLGTQMVAKGLDFPHVTLVGVIYADMQLLFPDFRSAEKTFQLLTQVAGRSGRSTIRGEVIIQTSQPEHYVLHHVLHHDVKGFLNIELFHRKGLLYPPYSRIALIEFRGTIEHAVKTYAETFAHLLKNNNGLLHILGPTPAALERLRGVYRFHILLKSPREKDKTGAHLHSAIRTTLSKFRQTATGKTKHVKIIIDIDPVGMM